MSIRKLRAGRVPRVTADEFVGEKGTIFWDESVGRLKLSNGITPGGSPLPIYVAAPGIIGGIKPGPGVIIANDGTLTIDSSGLSFNFGDFFATTELDGTQGASLSSVNADQDINIVSNGTGSINVIGELKVYKPDGSVAGAMELEPILRVKNDGQIKMLVPGADTTEGAVGIVGGLDGVFQIPANTGVMLHVTGIAGSPGVPSRIYNDAQNAFAAYVARRYNGTAAAPMAVLADEEIMRLSGTAHNGTNIPGTANNRIVYKALGNQTLTNAGGSIELWTTPLNSTTLAKVATIDNANGITATKFTGPLTGNVTGKADTAGNADTVTNGVYTSGSYSDPSWLTISKTKVGLSNVENTALSTWAGSANLITTGTLTNLVVAGTMRYDGAQNNATGNTFNKTGGTVTANGRTGQLTTNADLLAKGTAGTFTVNNTYITSAKDVVIVNLASGGTVNSYAVAVTRIDAVAGSFNITVHNNSAGPLSEALVINFAVLKVS